MTSIKQKVSVLSLLADVMVCKDHENFERQGLNGKTNIFTLDKSTTEITNIMASLLFIHSILFATILPPHYERVLTRIYEQV